MGTGMEKEGGGGGGGADERPIPTPAGRKNNRATGKRSSGKSVGRVKNELKTVDQIRKTRKVAENRRAKNARPTHKGKRR